MKFGIVMDSCSDAKNNYFQDNVCDLTVVPLKIICNGHEYIDNDDVDMENLLIDMDLDKKYSKTSCPTPYDFLEAYQKNDYTFCITMSSKLSGTYNSAMLAKSLLEEQNPEKKVFVIDSLSTTGTMLLIAEEAHKLIEQGKSFEEICPLLVERRDSIDLIFNLVSYDSLVRAGRMSNFMKNIANTLNIKLICKGVDGEIVLDHKVRGSKKTYQKMADIILSAPNIKNRRVFIHHCNNLEGANYIIDLIKDNIESYEIVPCKALASFYAIGGGLIISY